MIVAGSTSPLLLSSAGGYNLTNSLRFRSSASAYLNRTLSTPTNNKLFTWSGWVKRSQIGVWNDLFGAGGANGFGFNTAWNDNGLAFFTNNGSGDYFFLVTTQVFRDPSAWYHIVLAVDTTQATPSNRAKIYVNGVQITAFNSPVYQSQGSSLTYNSATAHYLGSLDGSIRYLDGYLAELNFIDGQQLTPSSFGETSSSTGVWIPKKYTGTYGNNGFYLPFTNTSSTSTLGNDFSGNSNTWTVNNISLTAGTTYDSMTDVPTLTSATTANYATLNPLANPVGTLANGNLQISTTTDQKVTTATMALPSTGQYYFEITATDYVTDGGVSLGLVNSPFLTTFPANGTYIGMGTYSGNYNNGTTSDNTNLTGTNVTQDGDIWCFAIDVTNNKFWAGRSRSGTLVWADGVTPSVNGSGASTLSLPTGNLYPMIYRGGSYNEIYNFNFGQQPFVHTPPTGFVRLNTFNLTTPTIGATATTQAGDYFNAVTWTGTGNSGRSITGVGFQPDFVWAKNRTNAYGHVLFDVLRGAGGDKELGSQVTGAEGYASTATYDYLSAFNTDGFTSTWSGSNFAAYFNNSGNNFVAWNWKANGAGVSNTAGSITSTVSANTTAGFSIVTYTGTGSAATIGHGLGVTPAMFIVKSRSTTGNWNVYHANQSATPQNGILYLNLTDAFFTLATWNNTAPTSSVFSINGSGYGVNNSSVTYVAYCFAPVAGYSAFGSYTGNGSSDGTFVFTGFRPRYLMMKSTSVESWELFDTSRSPYNQAVELLEANSDGAENTSSTSAIDILSNGFKQRNTRAATNGSGTTYIYMAFAENPFKYANAR